VPLSTARNGCFTVSLSGNMALLRSAQCEIIRIRVPNLFTCRIALAPKSIAVSNRLFSTYSLCSNSGEHRRCRSDMAASS
jgi:hypothetical protein